MSVYLASSQPGTQVRSELKIQSWALEHGVGGRVIIHEAKWCPADLHWSGDTTGLQGHGTSGDKKMKQERQINPTCNSLKRRPQWQTDTVNDNNNKIHMYNTSVAEKCKLNQQGDTTFHTQFGKKCKDT